MSLPLINGPGRGRGAGPMPPTLLQMPSVYSGNTGGRQPQPPAQPDFPMEPSGRSTLASGIATDLRSQTHAADSAPQPDGCARCRIWKGAVRSSFLWIVMTRSLPSYKVATPGHVHAEKVTASKSIRLPVVSRMC